MLGLQATLPRAVLVVAATWAAIFNVVSWSHGFSNIFYSFLIGLIAMVSGTTFGALVYSVYRASIQQDLQTSGDDRSDVHVKLFVSKDPTKNEYVTLPVPFSFTPPPRAPLSKVTPLLRVWPRYDWYVKTYPAHAALFNAIAATLAARMEMKASHVAGGHAGLSLFDHTLNVVRAADRLASRYRFFGLYRGDKLAIPVRDARGYYAFERDDPLVPLLAIAHDIGKLVSYGVENGKTVKLKEAHDIPGRRLLSLFPELYRIPAEDRQALLMAVGYYHHIHGGAADGFYRDGVCYSEWVGDRLYAAVHFIEYVDIQTGRIEAGEKPKPFFTPKHVAKTESREEDHRSPQPKTESETDAVEEMQPPKPRTMLDWFIEMIREEAGRRARKRAIVRWGDWLYVDDIAWRLWLKTHHKGIENPESLLRQPSMGVIHPVTAELLRSLAEKNCLLLDAGGHRYTAVNALYNVRLTRKDGGEVIRKFVIVFSSDICREARAIKESDFPLEPIESSFGAQRALKRAADPQQESPQEEVVIDDTSATLEDFVTWLSNIQACREVTCPPFPERQFEGKSYVIVPFGDVPKHLQSVDLGPLNPIYSDGEGKNRMMAIEKSRLKT